MAGRVRQLWRRRTVMGCDTRSGLEIWGQPAATSPLPHQRAARSRRGGPWARQLNSTFDSVVKLGLLGMKVPLAPAIPRGSVPSRVSLAKTER